MNDDEFVRAFEACRLSNGGFHHRDHIRLACIYLQRYGEADATERITQSIRNFAARHGKSEKYHQTMTVAWMRLVADAARRSQGGFEELTARFPALLDKSTLNAFYSEALLKSEAARSTFIEPDLKALSLQADKHDGGECEKSVPQAESRQP